MKYILFSLLFILLFGNSCKKKQLNFKFEGTVKASNSGNNLNGVVVKAFTYGLSDNKKTLKGSTTTDASGNYEINVERERFEKVLLEISKKNYFTASKSFPFDDLSTENTNPFNSSLSPKSWTKFIIQDIYSNDSSDQLKIQKVSGKTDCEECCPNTISYYDGIINTTVICPNDGDTYMKFYYWITVNGTVIDKVDSVYTTSFDTIPYTITY